MNSLHKAALGVAAARTAFGLYAMSDPARPARSWLGSHVDQVSAPFFGRAVGGRDLALGGGAVWALASRRDDRPLVAAMVAAGAFADALDAALTAKAWGKLPSPWKQATLGVALGSAVTGGVTAGMLVSRA